MFQDHLASKKHYLTEKEPAELIGLTSILPGPISNQTITAVGYRMGSPVLAVLTLLAWSLPPILVLRLNWKESAYDGLTITLFLFGCITTYFNRSPWIFSIVLPAVSIGASRENPIQ